MRLFPLDPKVSQFGKAAKLPPVMATSRVIHDALEQLYNRHADILSGMEKAQTDVKEPSIGYDAKQLEDSLVLQVGACSLVGAAGKTGEISRRSTGAFTERTRFFHTPRKCKIDGR